MEISRRTFLTASAASVALSLAGRESWAAVPGRGARGGQLPPAAGIQGEDGSRLWLRYTRLAAPAGYQRVIRRVVVDESSPTMSLITRELADGLRGLIGLDVAAATTGPALYVGTSRSDAIQRFNLGAEIAAAGDEGFIIRSMPVNGEPSTVIAGSSEIGVLYGTFHLLRVIATLQPIDRLNVTESPAMKIRMANHWDNHDGSIERGYAGRSMTFAADAAGGVPAWNAPGWRPHPRFVDYGRALASLGMNGVCLNNVNASAAMLSAESLNKVAKIADVLRPFGVRVYLAANFSAPRTLGNLATADPLDAGVQAWWTQKAQEIYALIPNFGGMLVKANSEGQPGPKDYNRTHAEGANCLAQAFAPHKGIVIWRAFVYDEHVDPDRVKRAYKEFMPLEGKFLPNVLVQIKNGPLDFQPREPFNPLFGALAKTSFMAEIQPSQEYLGQARHLVYLGTQWEEFLQSDTFAKGPGSTVAEVLKGKVQPVAMTGMAGVLNPGLDANWTGHHFSQANWYALGRFCWNPTLSAKAIAEEWVRMTFTHDAAAVETMADLMMRSHETFVNYTMPMGLHHMIGGNHYAPQPENAQAPRPDWTAVYYHQADKQAIGFDRTRRGNGGVDQYFKPLSDTLDGVDTCPEKFLLWFHRLPWDHTLRSGKALWAGLVEHYDRGVIDVRKMRATWEGLRGKVDERRHQEVAQRLEVQVADALVWRNHILAYFSRINGLPVPTAPQE